MGRRKSLNALFASSKAKACYSSGDSRMDECLSNSFAYRTADFTELTIDLQDCLKRKICAGNNIALPSDNYYTKQEMHCRSAGKRTDEPSGNACKTKVTSTLPRKKGKMKASETRVGQFDTTCNISGGRFHERRPSGAERPAIATDRTVVPIDLCNRRSRHHRRDSVAMLYEADCTFPTLSTSLQSPSSQSSSSSPLRPGLAKQLSSRRSLTSSPRRTQRHKSPVRSFAEATPMVPSYSHNSNKRFQDNCSKTRSDTATSVRRQSSRRPRRSDRCVTRQRSTSLTDIRNMIRPRSDSCTKRRPRVSERCPSSHNPLDEFFLVPVTVEPPCNDSMDVICAGSIGNGSKRPLDRRLDRHRRHNSCSKLNQTSNSKINI